MKVGLSRIYWPYMHEQLRMGCHKNTAVTQPTSARDDNSTKDHQREIEFVRHGVEEFRCNSASVCPSDWCVDDLLAARVCFCLIAYVPDMQQPSSLGVNWYEKPGCGVCVLKRPTLCTVRTTSNKK